MLAIGLLVSATASAIVGVALTPGGIPLRPRAPQELWRELLRDATPLAVSFLLVAVYLYVGLGLLARISTPEQVGLYDAAFRFMFLGVLLPSAVMSSIYAYAAAQAAEDRARFAQIARELLSLIVLLVPLPLIVMSADPAGVMTLLYGEAYAAGADILRVARRRGRTGDRLRHRRPADRRAGPRTRRCGSGRVPPSPASASTSC